MMCDLPLWQYLNMTNIITTTRKSVHISHSIKSFVDSPQNKEK